MYAKVLSLTPDEYERGEEPDPVDGVFYGIRFENGVSEKARYKDARRFAALGRKVVSPEEADRYLEKVRGSGEEPSLEGEAEEGAPETEEEPSLVSEPSAEAEVPEPAEEAGEALPSAEEVRDVQLPVGYKGQAPGYHDQLSEVADEGVSPHEVFGGQPTSEDLLKLYYWTFDA